MSVWRGLGSSVVVVVGSRVDLVSHDERGLQLRMWFAMTSLGWTKVGRVVRCCRGALTADPRLSVQSPKGR